MYVIPKFIYVNSVLTVVTLFDVATVTWPLLRSTDPAVQALAAEVQEEQVAALVQD